MSSMAGNVTRDKHLCLKSDPGIPLITMSILPVAAFSSPDVAQAANQFDAGKIFGMLVPELAFDAQA